MTAISRRTALALVGASLGAASPAMAQPVAPEASAAFAWRARAALPQSAQEIYPTLWNGEILVAGGFTQRDGQIEPTDQAFLYTPQTDRWRVGPALPRPRHHPQLLAVGDRLYALAGFEARDRDRVWVMQAGGWMKDAADAPWTPAPALPAPRGEAVVLAHEGRLHVIGGRSPTGEANGQWRDHGDVRDHRVLDPGAGVWEAARPAPSARNSAAGVAIGGRLYVVGGRRVGAGSNAELEAYDPREDRWDSLTPMPQAQGGLAAGVIDGQIVAFGGEFFAPDPGGVHAETWLYDVERDAWVAGPPMTTPRHGLGGVTIGDTIYAVGGATGVGADGTSAVVEALTGA